VAPHPVHDRARKPRVLLRRHPGGERLSRTVATIEIGAVEGGRRQACDRAEVGHLREARRDARRVHDLRATDDALLLGLESQGALVKERARELAEVVLLPGLGLVIVALRALDLRAEEDARSVAREILRGLLEAQREIHRAVLPVLAGGRDEITDDPIPRCVLREARLEPRAEGVAIHEIVPRTLARAHEDVVPIGRPVARVVFGREEVVDELFAFVGRFVREETLRRFGRRNGADDVDRDATKERRVVRARGGNDACFLPGGAERGVDARRAEGGRLLFRDDCGRCTFGRRRRGCVRASGSDEQQRQESGAARKHDGSLLPWTKSTAWGFPRGT
jgi:hypothetical protein